MMISTKGRYALTTLIDIAQNFDGVTPVSIKEISDRQKISMSPSVVRRADIFLPVRSIRSRSVRSSTPQKAPSPR